jgi:two-component system, LytTR family, response regulator
MASEHSSGDGTARAGGFISAAIIDDETKAIAVLKRLIARSCPRLQVVAEAEDIDEAIVSITQHAPQLVFLDVDLSGPTGFDLLEQLEDRRFHVILVTAHPEYAVKAFRYSVTDYLLKPIAESDLQQAVAKVCALIDQEPRQGAPDKADDKAARQTLRIPSTEGAIFVRMDDIIRLEAEGAYTHIHVKDRRHFSSYNLKQFEEHLDPQRFMRVHRSHVINLSMVKAVRDGRGLHVELIDGTQVPISRRHRADLLVALG